MCGVSDTHFFKEGSVLQSLIVYVCIFVDLCTRILCCCCVFFCLNVSECLLWVFLCVLTYVSVIRLNVDAKFGSDVHTGLKSNSWFGMLMHTRAAYFKSNSFYGMLMQFTYIHVQSIQTNREDTTYKLCLTKTCKKKS